MTNPTQRSSKIEPEHQGRTLFARPAAEGEVEHHGGSFKKYMVNKNQKLQEQFEEQSAAVQATAGQQTSDLFRGISIHVNGLTTPSLAVRLTVSASRQKWQAVP